MIGLLTGFFKNINAKEEKRILLLGIQGSGKSV